jgi:hypothetical protein
MLKEKIILRTFSVSYINEKKKKKRRKGWGGDGSTIVTVQSRSNFCTD